MGLFGGSTTTTTNEKFDTGPSSWQKSYLDDAFSGAQGAYNSQKGSPYYTGDTYAGMSPEAKAALDAMRNYASTTGLGAANTMSTIGANMAGYGAQAGANLEKYTTMLGEDATAANMSAAQRYADNPYLKGQIDAVGRDVSRNLSEDILPGIDRSASAGGNINSSRAGIASGIAQRGAADRFADISAQMRGDAWNKGLTMAQTDRANQMDGYRSAAEAYRGLTSTGLDALRAGAETGYGAFDRINAAGALEQADRQGQLDQAYDQWKGQDTRDWDLLNRYYGVVGSNQWGQSGTSSGTSKTKESGSVLSGILGLASTAASFIPSDRRLKKNIRKVGELEDGLGVYTWSYLWEPSAIQHVGVMAQEVADKRPEALGPTILGFMTVNYARL